MLKQNTIKKYKYTFPEFTDILTKYLNISLDPTYEIVIADKKAYNAFCVFSCHKEYLKKFLTFDKNNKLYLDGPLETMLETLLHDTSWVKCIKPSHDYLLNILKNLGGTILFDDYDVILFKRINKENLL